MYTQKVCFTLASFVLFSALGSAQPVDTLTPGVPVLGRILCQQTDEYNIPLRAGDKLLLHLTETFDFGGICAGHAALAFDQCLDVYDASDQLLDSACTPHQENARTQFRTQLGPVPISSDGNYKVVVRDANNRGSGNYTLWVQNTTSPANFQTLEEGVPRLKSVQSPGEVHTFVFDAAGSASLGAEMKTQTGELVPRLALYLPGGEPLSLPEGGLIDTVAPVSGRYTLLAFSAVSEQGTYLIEKNSGPSSSGSSDGYPTIKTSHVFPQVAYGSGWQSSIITINASNSATGCQASLHDVPEGTDLFPHSSFTLPLKGSVELLRIGNDSLADDGLLTGYATLSCDGEVAAFVSFGNFTPSGDPIGMATVFSSDDVSEAVLPLYLGFGDDLGIAISNNSDDALESEIRIYDVNEAVVGLTRIRLEPRTHLARFISQLLPTVFETDSGFAGKVTVSAVSEGRFSIIGLLFNGEVFTTIPATPLSP